jgi:hypothetical protein
MKPIIALGGAALLGVHLLTSEPGLVAHQSTTTAVATLAPRTSNPSSSLSASVPSAPEPGAYTPASPVSPPSSGTSGSPAPAEPRGLAPGDGPGADATVQHLLEQSSPLNLPVAEAHSLEHLGRQVWLADVTGTGRSRWPQYFGASGTSSYTAVRVQAAIARADGPDQVTVTLLWAGTSPGGDPQVALPGTVHLADQSGTWEPTR